jgi:hypothetical protein
MTHTHYGRSHVHPIGQLTNIRRSDGSPEPDGDLKVVDRKKIIHYLQLYINHPEPIAFYRLQLTRQAAFMMTFFV